MSGRKTLSDDAYTRVSKEAEKAGSATHKGEQRHREGKGLHELVDPKGYGAIRRALSFCGPIEGGKFKLERGVAMLEETRFDTTGSMGGNIAIAFRVLPKTYKLLSKIEHAVLERYDTQMITGIFGDVVDEYVLARSQAEFDERIAEQMTLLYPEKGGGDNPEDPQYGLFGGAYLTQADINRYGLKYYDFTLTDAPGKDRVSIETLERVFGKDVWEYLKENSAPVDKKALPTTAEIVKDLSKNAFPFLLLVEADDDLVRRWGHVYSKEYIVSLPRTELVSEVKAAIIGLIEGTLSLQTVEEFLRSEAKIDKVDALSIKRAVAGIPIGAQMAFPNFNKIPKRGDLFANKRDLWPIGYDEKGDKIADFEAKPKTENRGSGGSRKKTKVWD